jgi:hypothetical protein
MSTKRDWMVCGIALAALLLGGGSARAQTGAPQIINASQHDVSAPLRSIAPGRAPVLPGADRTALAGTIPGLSFNGIGAAGWVVPDTEGAVGATQFVEWVNTSFAVYDKQSGALIYGPAAGSTLWTGFGGNCGTLNSGDPIVLYDKLAARWIFTARTTPVGGPYTQCFAVSTTSDATGTYNRYVFSLATNFPDYPKMGVWPDAYYLTINEQTGKNFKFLQTLLCAMDRNAMLAGGAATAQCFPFNPVNAQASLLPSDLDGTTPPPVGSPNYLLNLGPNALNMWKLHIDFVNPKNSNLTGPSRITVTAFSQACNGGVCIPQTGTSNVVDSLGDRLMYRLAYRNLGSHESLVVTHSVKAGASVGVRWYEIQNPGGTPVVTQQGTYAPDSSFRWMGSIAMDKLGDIAVGYSVSSSSLHPSIRYAGRVPTDPLGTLETETSIIAGTGSQIGSGRWGDYSSMTVDPVDDCTFWYTNQYLTANGNHNWSTRIASFKFPTCQ